MNPAIYDTVSADIDTDQEIVLRATGSIIKFRGFLVVYEEKQDEEEVPDEDKLLPALEKNQKLRLIEVTSEQSFTKPPPRFSEASLVKELEKSGIGRPSTYASIMNKIQRREYTVKEQGRLKPTELGKVIAQFLETNFQMIMNIGFTAEMEDTLELIADGKKVWKEVIKDFWGKFIPTVDVATKEAVIPRINTDIECPKCKIGHLQKIWAKGRYFYGCDRYPECDYAGSIEALSFNKEEYAPGFDWDQPCPVCKSPMTLRHGRFGPFLGCQNYPKCKGIVNIPKKGEEVVSHEDLPNCPAIGCDGKIVERKSRFGKKFFSCSNFPDCDVIANDIDQLADKYQEHPKTAYEKKIKGGGKGRGAKSKHKLSKELAAVVGVDEESRAQVIKKMWEYIKANNCQDPDNKRNIIPDEKLAAVFGSNEPIDMFKLAGIIARHFQK